MDCVKCKISCSEYGVLGLSTWLSCTFTKLESQEELCDLLVRNHNVNTCSLTPACTSMSTALPSLQDRTYHRPVPKPNWLKLLCFSSAAPRPQRTRASGRSICAHVSLRLGLMEIRHDFYHLFLRNTVRLDTVITRGV
jgi:hypothetical protein